MSSQLAKTYWGRHLRGTHDTSRPQGVASLASFNQTAKP